MSLTNEALAGILTDKDKNTQPVQDGGTIFPSQIQTDPDDDIYSFYERMGLQYIPTQSQETPPEATPGKGFMGTAMDIGKQLFSSIEQSFLDVPLAASEFVAYAKKKIYPEGAEAIEKGQEAARKLLQVRPPAETTIGQMVGDVAEFSMPFGVVKKLATKGLLKVLSRPKAVSSLATGAGFAGSTAVTEFPEFAQGEISLEDYAKEIGMSGVTGSALGIANQIPVSRPVLRLIGEYAALTGTRPLIEGRTPRKDELIYNGVLLGATKAIDRAIVKIAKDTGKSVEDIKKDIQKEVETTDRSPGEVIEKQFGFDPYAKVFEETAGEKPKGKVQPLSQEELGKQANAIFAQAAPVQVKLENILSTTSKEFGAEYKSNQKSVKSIIDKVTRKSEEDPEYNISSLKDITRGAILLKDISQTADVIQSIRKQVPDLNAEVFVTEPLNDFGYRGIHLSTKIEGIGAEIQIHTKESWAIKEKTDLIYRKWRNAEITKENFLESKAAKKESSKLWSDYWDKALSDLFTKPRVSTSSLESGLASKKSPPVPSKSTQPEGVSTLGKSESVSPLSNIMPENLPEVNRENLSEKLKNALRIDSLKASSDIDKPPAKELDVKGIETEGKESAGTKGSIPHGEGVVKRESEIVEKPTREALEKADFVTLPTSIIKEKYQPREMLSENQVKNITDNYNPALFEPLILNKEKDGYYLISGHHRLEAAKRLGIDVPAKVVSVSEAEARTLAAQANENRLEHTALEQSKVYQNEIDNGLSLSAVAVKFNKPATFIENRLAINALSPAMKDKVRDNFIPISHATEFAKAAKHYGWNAQTQDEIYRELYVKYGTQLTADGFKKMLTAFAPRMSIQQLGLFSIEKTDLQDRLQIFFNTVKELESKIGAYKNLIRSSQKLGGKESDNEIIKMIADQKGKFEAEINSLQDTLNDMTRKAGIMTFGIGGGAPSEGEILADMERKTNEFMGTKDKDIVIEGKQWGVNFDRINTTDEVKLTIGKIAKVYNERIDKLKRGKVPFEQTKAEASGITDIGKKLLSGETEESYKKLSAEILAARDLEVQSAKELEAVRKFAEENPKDKDAYYRLVKRLAIHSELQAHRMAMSTEIARALGIHRMSVSGDLPHHKEVENLINNISSIPPEELPHRIKELKTEEQIRTFTEQLRRNPSMFLEAYVNGLLSGPQTHAANVLGNIYMTFAGPMERGIAARLHFGKDPGVMKGEGTAMIYGLQMGFMDALRMAQKAFQTGEPVFGSTKLENAYRKAITAQNLDARLRRLGLGFPGSMSKAVDMLGNIVRIPGRLLITADEFFKAINYRMELHAQAFRQVATEGLEGEAAGIRMNEILQNPSVEVKARAESYANYATFTGEMSDIGKGLSRFAENNPAARVIIPFIRTPDNIIHYQVEHTPLLNLVSKRARADLRGVNGAAARDMAMGKLMLGSMVMAAGAMLANAGFITGSGPRDKDLQKQMRDNGWQPHSIKFGGKYYAYNRLDPAGSFLGMVADFQEIREGIDDFTAGNLATAIGLSMYNNLFDKTYLEGIMNIVEAIQEPEKRWHAYLKKQVGAIIPAGVAQVTRVLDPTIKELNTFMDVIKSRVPGYSEEVPASRNLFGEKRLREGSLGPDWLSPIYKSTAKGDPVMNEVINQGVSINPISKFIGGARPPTTDPLAKERPVHGITLTPKQYEKLVIYSTDGLKKELEKLIGSPMYQAQSDGPDGGKALLINNLVSAFRERGRLKLIQEDQELQDALKEKEIEKIRALTPVSRRQVPLLPAGSNR